MKFEVSVAMIFTIISLNFLYVFILIKFQIGIFEYIKNNHVSLFDYSASKTHSILFPDNKKVPEIRDSSLYQYSTYYSKSRKALHKPD